MLSPESGFAAVNPANSTERSAVSTLSHTPNDVEIAVWNCCAVTPVVPRSVT